MPFHNSNNFLASLHSLYYLLLVVLLNIPLLSLSWKFKSLELYFVCQSWIIFVAYRYSDLSSASLVLSSVLSNKMINLTIVYNLNSFHS